MQSSNTICEHPPAQQKRLFEAGDYLTGDRFDIIQCGECSLVRTVPAPAPAEMQKYYPAVYYAGAAGRRFPAPVELLQKLLYSRRVRRIERLHGGRKGRVLDVGCGPGFLLRQFQMAGWEAQGTELSAQSAAHAREKFGLAIHTGELASALFPSDHFDAVVLWHVLEHVPCPQTTVTEVVRILRPGGIFLVAVPNFGSCEARLAREKWFHLDVPRHLSHFTVPALTGLLTSAGLQIKSCSFLAPEYDSFSFVQSALNRLGLRHNLLYGLLRQGRGTVLKRANTFQILATLLLAAPLSLLSVPVTLLAALLRQGASVSIYARKPL